MSSPLSIQTRSSVKKHQQDESSSIITQQFLCDQIVALKSHFDEKLRMQKDDIINQLQNENLILKSEVLELKSQLKDKSELLISIEKDVIDVQQYIRRNNVEICGIPNSVSDKDLEAKVIDLAASIDVSISKSNIEACHRLPNKKDDGTAKRTIVRFVNRKFCELLHANKKKLKNPSNHVKNKLKNANLPQGKIFINNNLCPYNKYLWGKCKRLHEEKLIDRFWIFNGYLYISDNQDDPKGTRISHINVLKEKYPGYNFNIR